MNRCAFITTETREANVRTHTHRIDLPHGTAECMFSFSLSSYFNLQSLLFLIFFSALHTLCHIDNDAFSCVSVCKCQPDVLYQITH